LIGVQGVVDLGLTTPHELRGAARPGCSLEGERDRGQAISMLLLPHQVR
jgi:hypothetical protein